MWRFHSLGFWSLDFLPSFTVMVRKQWISTQKYRFSLVFPPILRKQIYFYWKIHIFSCIFSNASETNILLFNNTYFLLYFLQYFGNKYTSIKKYRFSPILRKQIYFYLKIQILFFYSRHYFGKCPSMTTKRLLSVTVYKAGKTWRESPSRHWTRISIISSLRGQTAWRRCFWLSVFSSLAPRTLFRFTISASFMKITWPHMVQQIQLIESSTTFFGNNKNTDSIYCDTPIYFKLFLLNLIN